MPGKKGFVRLINRIIERKDNSFAEYKDYLGIRDKLPKRMQKKLPVVVPRKKIHNYHQRAVYDQEQYLYKKEQKKVARLNAKYQEHLAEPSKYGLQYVMEDAEFKIYPALELKALFDEGSYLHHCVAGYYEAVAKGATAIYFLRKKTYPGTPFFTIEATNGCVTQVFTFYDQPMKKESLESRFVKKWMKKYGLEEKFYYG